MADLELIQKSIARLNELAHAMLNGVCLADDADESSSTYNRLTPPKGFVLVNRATNEVTVTVNE